MQTDKHQEVRDWEEELIKLLAIYRRKTAGRIITEDYTDSFPEQIVKDFIRSLMQQRDRELEKALEEMKKDLYTEMGKGVMCAVKGAPGYNEALKDISNLIQSNNKENGK